MGPFEDGAREKKSPPRAPARKANPGSNGLSWSSAISFSAKSTASTLRDLLEEMKIDFRRERSEKPYSQLYAVIPYPRFAYVFRFVIRGMSLIIDIYDIHPATSGPLSFIEIPRLTDRNIELARTILRGLAGKLPRRPWEFTWLQRIQHGLLNPDILRARRNWRSIGVLR